MELSYVEIDRNDKPLGEKGAGNDRSYRDNTFPKPITPAAAPRSTAEHFANPCNCFVDFWLKNPLTLFQEHYVIPRKTMTLNQKLNAIVRLALLLAFSCHFLLGMSRSIFYVVILAMIGTIFIYYSPSLKTKMHPVHMIHNERVVEIIASQIQNNDNIAQKNALTHTDLNLIAAQTSLPPQIIKTAIKDVLPEVNVVQAEILNEPQIAQSNEIFNIPKNYEWDKSDKTPYEKRLYTGIDEAYTEETTNQREVLLSYSDMLDGEFEKELTKDFYGKESQWWRDQGSFLVDRDVYHPKNSDLFFDPY
jgi:hypothetical protein